MDCSAPVQQSRHSTPGSGMIWTIGVPSVWKFFEVTFTKSETSRVDIVRRCTKKKYEQTR